MYCKILPSMNYLIDPVRVRRLVVRLESPSIEKSHTLKRMVRYYNNGSTFGTVQLDIQFRLEDDIRALDIPVFNGTYVQDSSPSSHVYMILMTSQREIRK